MRNRLLGKAALSLIGGFVGAAMFHVAVGVNVEAEESPRNLMVDSISVKQLTLYNHKNEVVGKLAADPYGLPRFVLGRNELNRIDFNFITENQPSIKVMGGMGKSYSMMSVRNQGPFWEPMISLGHRDEKEGVMMSIFRGAGNVIVTNNQNESLRFDASQGNTWRKVVLHPSASLPVRSLSPRPSVPYSHIKNR